MGKYAVGIDVGGTKIAYGVFDENRNLISKHRHNSDSALEPERFFDKIATTIKDLLDAQNIGKQDFLGIGIAMPSFIDFEKGLIVKTSNLVKIKDFPARDYLKEKFGEEISIVLSNDAHAAAIAEHAYGAGRGFRHMLFCPVSTGISSAIIINGELFRGTYGWAGESGHAIATPGLGLECGCDNTGCFMSWTSGSMLPKHLQGWIASGEETIMTEYVDDPKELTMEHIDRAFMENDALAVKAVEQMVKTLAVWTYNLYVILNINCYVFGGGLLEMNARIIERVQAEFDVYNKSDLPVYFKKAELGDTCGIIGASELVFGMCKTAQPQ